MPIASTTTSETANDGSMVRWIANPYDCTSTCARRPATLGISASP
jgi:hypothetical protein